MKLAIFDIKSQSSTKLKRHDKKMEKKIYKFFHFLSVYFIITVWPLASMRKIETTTRERAY